MEDLIPIGAVADRFDLPVSTLHYWERRGLIKPHRRSGRRYYDDDLVYRIALIRLCQENGLMSLDEIKLIVEGRAPALEWRTAVKARLATIENSIRQLRGAQEYLTHLLTCEQERSLDRCPHFRADIGLSCRNRVRIPG
ncbi:MerR family transcriptional regulator [Spirillospora sp. CA-294931]|uniref:MerR family transcriptional regulator n=1 Tax=Spirillospora sp. CA-294931 TaxID=3240042 RepID=UPI003D922237